jgi:hypothetical protein
MSAAQIGGTLAGGYAQMQAGRAEADVLEGQAVATLDAAKAEADRFRRATTRARGQARAALAGAGVDVTQGTPLVIDEDIARRGEQEALMTLLTGERGARALRFKAQTERAVGNAEMASALTRAVGQASRVRWRGAAPREVDNFSPFYGDPFSGV